MKKYLTIILSIIFIIATLNISQKPEKIINEIFLDEPSVEVSTYSDYQNLGEFRITYYCPCAKCCEKSDGITATGTIATEGRTVAVDPKVIPYGTVIYIEGIGARVAEDCGGAVKNNVIDVFVDTTHQEAIKMGRKKLKVYKILNK